ncbi:Putative F-box/FBD/LRR-repeat protein [Striga hermonthica]|uniref:F-box/FBD/LRR-repeat protein n=1 Tax=Striga hermonthica TaxID=68872 RepID=A0A9N7NND9_STRHE|nr:Putative F-box/FBD/LRR-repeat protein [Striga hermonthica]
MENQPAKRKKACPNSGDGRISELPQPLLHNILAFLSQEEATRTSVLSKSWRSIGPTRPKIEFNEACYEGNHEKFLSNLDSTLQFYHGREIRLQEFILCLKPLRKVLSRHLRKVSFSLVDIEDKHLQKIMSNCPMIEQLAIEACHGITTVEVHNDNLKHFEYRRSVTCYEGTIKIDAPNIESIKIVGRSSWLHNGKTFVCLKSLLLEYVVLTQKDFDSFSVDFCCLEDLKIHFCRGFEEFQLSSRSIKRLHLAVDGPTKAAIDLPNIRCFELLCDDFPSITLTTNSSEWRSLILLKQQLITKSETSLFYVKLNELLRALNHSRIHLHMRDFPLEVLHGYGNFGEPAVIESLAVAYRHSCSSLEASLNYFFGRFRPRYIEQSVYPLSVTKEYEDIMAEIYAYEEEANRLFFQWYAARAAEEFGIEDEVMNLPAVPETNENAEANEFIDRLWIFLMKKESEDRIWQQDLEEASPRKDCSFPEWKRFNSIVPTLTLKPGRVKKPQHEL